MIPGDQGASSKKQDAYCFRKVHVEDSSIDREILTLAWPAILEMVLHMFVWIVDTAMVGRLGAGALSAVGLGGSVYWTAVWVFGAVSVGVTAMVARATGSRDNASASFAGGQGLLLGFGLGALLALGMFVLAPWIYKLARFERGVAAAGIDYVRIVGAGALLFIPLQVGSGILRGSGNTRTPFYITLVANSMNAIGDYGLVFGKFGLPELGVRGAAIATLAAHISGGILILAVLFCSRRRPASFAYEPFSRKSCKGSRDSYVNSCPDSYEDLSCESSYGSSYQGPYENSYQSSHRGSYENPHGDREPPAWTPAPASGELVRFKDIARVHVPTMKALFALSVPAGAEEALMNGSRMVSSFMIAALGTDAFAANQVTVAAESLSFMPGYGFAVAAGILVGQNLGARKPDNAMLVGRRSLRYSVAVMGGVGLIFLLVPHLIVRIFTNDVQVVRIASTCLRIAALEQVAIGTTDVLCGSLRGAGDTRTALRITATGTWAVRIPLIAISIYLLKLTLPAVWVITCLDWSVRAVLAMRYFRTGRWQRIRIQDNDPRQPVFCEGE